MKVKSEAVAAAIDGMIDAGLSYPRAALQERIDAIYRERGLEYQQVLDDLLLGLTGRIDPKIHASGIVAYRKARSAMVLYPHVQMTLLELAKRGIRLGVVSDAPRAQVRSEEHTSELQSHVNLVCRLLLEKKKKNKILNSLLGKKNTYNTR